MKLKNTARLRLKYASLGFAILSALNLYAASVLDNVVEVIESQTSEVDGFAALIGDTTWSASETIVLRDTLIVPDGVVLTIEAGTTIYSTRDDNGTEAVSDDEVGAIVVTRGGRIEAAGTPSAPIVFTAIEELEVDCNLDLNEDGLVGPQPTVSTSGLWGGILVLGNADITVNDSNGTDLNNEQIEGFAPTGVSNDGDSFIDFLEYGFDGDFPQDDADNSGTLQYVRIQHGGFAFGEGNEINGLTLGGVGTGTTIDFVEIVSSSDDGIEFFGGTVNTSHIAVAFCEDDSFDLDNGVTGLHQFWFAVQNPIANHLGEWDGLNGSLSNVSAASSPQIFNATFIGPGLEVGDADSALFIDDAFSGSLNNSLISEKEQLLVDFATDGLQGSFSFTNNTVGFFGDFDGTSAASVLSSNAPDNFYVDSFFGLETDGNSAPSTPLELVGLERSSEGFLVSIDPRPIEGSSADVGTLAEVPSGLETVDYRGAFAPGAEVNWLAGWSFLSENGFLAVGGEAPSEIAIIDSAFLGATSFSITFASEANQTYRVVGATDLSSEFDFELSTGIDGTGDDVVVNVTHPGGSRFFFRVEEE